MFRGFPGENQEATLSSAENQDTGRARVCSLLQISKIILIITRTTAGTGLSRVQGRRATAAPQAQPCQPCMTVTGEAGAWGLSFRSWHDLPSAGCLCCRFSVGPSFIFLRQSAKNDFPKGRHSRGSSRLARRGDAHAWVHIHVLSGPSKARGVLRSCQSNVCVTPNPALVIHRAPLGFAITKCSQPSCVLFFAPPRAHTPACCVRFCRPPPKYNRRRCEEGGCSKWPLYAFEGEKAKYCSQHKVRQWCGRLPQVQQQNVGCRKIPGAYVYESKNVQPKT